MDDNKKMVFCTLLAFILVVLMTIVIMLFAQNVKLERQAKLLKEQNTTLSEILHEQDEVHRRMVEKAIEYYEAELE